MKKRYGKFNFSDYCASHFALLVLLSFSVLGWIIEAPVILLFFPIVFALIWAWTIFSPHREQFVIKDDSITTFIGKKTKTIPLPSGLTLVISCADIAPPLTRRTAIGNTTHILKDKIAVSVLQDMETEYVLNRLHQNHVKTYTQSMIKADFDGYGFIYSFVYYQDAFDKIIEGRKCSIIIPESLKEKVIINSSNVDVYIDPKS